MLRFIDSVLEVTKATVWACLECGCQFGFTFTDKANEDKDPKFCPNCGAQKQP